MRKFLSLAAVALASACASQADPLDRPGPTISARPAVTPPVVERPVDRSPVANGRIGERERVMAARPAMPPPSFEQPLTPEAIRDVQRRMRALGFYAGELDGVWGPSSQLALERFQRSRGLPITGQLNPATVAELRLEPSNLVGASTAPGALPPGQVLDRGVVRAIQQRLRQVGFSTGSADGVWGPQTQAALERFQQNRGLQVTGQPDPNTLAALGLDPNNLLAETGAGSSVRR